MDRVCPLLGLLGDRRSAIDGVDGSHRCYADAIPITLERQQQARVCLTDAYRRCDRYAAHVSRHGGVRPGEAGFGGDGFVSTRLLLAPEPSWRGIAGKARRARSGPLAAIGAGVAALGIGGVTLATGLLDGSAAGALPSTALTSATASITPTPSQRPSRTPAPTASATPTPAVSFTPAPTPTPTVAPTLAPTQPLPTAAARTYTVRQGDTLAAIAQQFVTTVAAIQEANGIEDPNEILVGQVLVIP